MVEENIASGNVNIVEKPKTPVLSFLLQMQCTTYCTTYLMRGVLDSVCYVIIYNEKRGQYKKLKCGTRVSILDNKTQQN